MLFASAGAQAGLVLSEGFNGPTLPTGWATATGAGAATPSLWGKPIDVGGPSGEFAAQSGPADSYLKDSNPFFDVVATIADYLITPALTINNGTRISFWVKGDPLAEASFPDDLRVLFSPSATSTAPTSFTRLIADLNPAFTPTGIPTDWTLFSFVVNGLSGPTTGRFAFEYFVDNTAAHGDFIGLDTVTVFVPEPDAMLLMSLGLVALGVGTRRSRKAAARA